jgi:DNA modification methylase
MIHNGDCVEVMAAMPESSVDAIVCDPPYGLEFMGKEWDKLTGAGFADIGKGKSEHALATGRPSGRRGFDGYGFTPSYGKDTRAMQQWHQRWATEAFRVAKPGAYLLAFGGTRTYHRLAVAIEDAGWIIRDCLVWAYASGFPKSKALLKPAWEPIVMARKPGPLRELAIDACRIPTSANDRAGWYDWSKENVGRPKFDGVYTSAEDGPTVQASEPESAGRWPANVLLTPTEDGRAIFDGGVAGVVGGDHNHDPGTRTRREKIGGTDRFLERTGDLMPDAARNDSDAGYSRFFLIPKSARSEREPVFGGLEAQHDDPDGSFGLDAARPHTKPDYQYKRKPRTNVHPTVKPLDLMRHLVRLVTPQGGTVLDPFLGSGTTAIAAEMEGFAWIGIEREPEYVAIAEARLMGVQRGLGLDVA